MKKIVIILCMMMLTSCAQSPESKNEPPKKSTESLQKEETETKEAEEVVSKSIAPEYKINSQTSAVEPIGGAPAKVALLTIDDAPDKYALEMAKTLKGLDAKAIFFVNGIFLESEEQKQILKEIAGMGFEIGNHTHSHPDLKTLSEEKQREEILSLNDAIEGVIGNRPRFFRAPYGSNTPVSNELARQEGMTSMKWTYGYDFNKEYREPAALTNIMVNTPLLTNGANLLMHDKKWTSEALEGIVSGLRAKGYTFVDPKAIQTP
ncbi:peptidoglycan/xylan/chitin deacetylase (PgdA/CDA1 family) [Bacillus ectoiniformans]|uniref:polysaccharide deacetylase family protein n=1 Tax=Bacillus ectoiniformans TaxID=1494429 RepID=UPI00195DFF19|nr:polysaccharide deacetylase family protein [Bacillus ectoiniformans]MBM7647278.1 peptidoglycan/xylan/chitin deacetylase (PgdA/CDA1 family) [Bacillus ectoiniformans]